MTNAREVARAAFGPDLDFEARVTAELETLKVRLEAKRILEEELAPARPLPTIETLRARLARPLVPLAYRVEGFQPIGGNVVLAAQFKAGKSTLRNNYIRSLVDGDPFLGAYAVRPVTGSIVNFDLEMGETQGVHWLRDHGIRNDDQVIVVHLRGNIAAFDILSERGRGRVVEALRPHQPEVLIVDCWRPLLDAFGLDEHRDAGRMLNALDAFKADVGASEMLIVHHMGHSGERGRGDSRLRDWPDAEWRLMRQDDNPASARFLTAFGRDVSQDEQRLDYDRVSRRLSVVGGTRHDTKHEGALDVIVSALRANPGKHSGRAIKGFLQDSELTREEIEQGLKLGRQRNVLGSGAGKYGASLHWLSSVPVSGPYKGPGHSDTSEPGHSRDTRDTRDTSTGGVDVSRF